MSTRDLVENYATQTNAVEMNHSAAADSTARTSPMCFSVTILIADHALTTVGL